MIRYRFLIKTKGAADKQPLPLFCRAIYGPLAGYLQIHYLIMLRILIILCVLRKDYTFNICLIEKL